jgi:hypothetical protein
LHADFDVSPARAFVGIMRVQLHTTHEAHAVAR